MKSRIFIILFTLLTVTFFACRQPAGTLRIIHAGSLSVPVREAAGKFEKLNPGVRVLTEAWGSKAGARRVSDLDVPCDVFISADYKVIDNFLIPDHASWNISFAGNEMAIVYTGNSRYAGEINSGNWYGILLRMMSFTAGQIPGPIPAGLGRSWLQSLQKYITIIRAFQRVYFQGTII